MSEKGAPENDWPQHKLLIMQNMDDCREKQREQDKMNDDQEKRITDLYQRDANTNSRVSRIAAAISAGVGVVMFLAEKLFDRIIK